MVSTFSYIKQSSCDLSITIINKQEKQEQDAEQDAEQEKRYNIFVNGNSNLSTFVGSISMFLGKIHRKKEEILDNILNFKCSHYVCESCYTQMKDHKLELVCPLCKSD